MLVDNSDIFGIRYLEAAIRGLDSSRIRENLGTGLYSATEFKPSQLRAEITSGDSPANDDNYSLSWVRDTLKCSAYDLIAGNVRQLQAMTDTLLSYFKNNISIIDQTIRASHRGQTLDFCKHAIMPRMNPLTLEPVHADQMKSLQLDMAEFLKHVALLSRKKVVFLDALQDLELIEKLIEYFLAWDYSMNAEIPGDFGIWEEGKGGTQGKVEPEIHSSSIAAMLAGLIFINGESLEAKDGSKKFISIDKQEIERGFQLLNDRIDSIGETEERPYDLTGLMILYDHLILKELDKDGLLEEANVEKLLQSFPKLERTCGFVRYASDKNLNALDDYRKDGSPKRFSAEWPMGFGYAALIYATLGQIDTAIKYVEKMEQVFDWNKGLGLPEAYFGGTQTPVPVSPLSWSNALYLMTYETLRQRYSAMRVD